MNSRVNASANAAPVLDDMRAGQLARGAEVLAHPEPGARQLWGKASTAPDAGPVSLPVTITGP